MKEHSTNKRYCPHLLVHSVEVYRQTKDAAYVCRRYHISKASLMRWNRQFNLHPGLVKFIKLLDDPYNLSRPLNDLIAQTGFSYPHINRLFHSEMNTSAGKYFQQKKDQSRRSAFTKHR